MLSDTGRAWEDAELACPRGCPVARPGRLLLACGCLPLMSGRTGRAVPWRASGAPAQARREEARQEVLCEVRLEMRPEHHGRTAGAGRQGSRHGRPVHGRRRAGLSRHQRTALPAAAIGRASQRHDMAHVSGGHGNGLAMPAGHEVLRLVLHGLRILHRRKVLPAHLHEHASGHPGPVRPQRRLGMLGADPRPGLPFSPDLGLMISADNVERRTGSGCRC